jgi:DNA primase
VERAAALHVAARAYAAKRRLSKSSVEGFLLGYAPRQGTLVAAAAKKGFPAELLMKCGLAAKRADGTVRDYFFDRFMFPIRDAKGQFVGFGGRTLGDGEPKYLNSPESPVFAKSRVLYGLFEGLAETRKARKAHMMEGYMDVIAAHQHGLKNACAPLGTALTPEHAALIKRYADAVVIVFDADAAGQTAPRSPSRRASTRAWPPCPRARIPTSSCTPRGWRRSRPRWSPRWTSWPSRPSC